MTNIQSKNNHIEVVAEKNKEKTTIKVREALERLKKSKKLISIQKVADEAEISRKTLYNRPDLKAMVEEFNALISDTKRPKEKSNNPKRNLKEERLIKLREQNKELKEDKKKILDENMRLTEKVLELELKIEELEERFINDKAINLVNIRK